MWYSLIYILDPSGTTYVVYLSISCNLLGTSHSDLIWGNPFTNMNILWHFLKIIQAYIANSDLICTNVVNRNNAGGSEIWVFDPEARRRVLRIPLQAWGLSLAVGRGEEPKVLVTNPTDMSVELYDGLTGSFMKKITGFGQETPLLLRGAE